MLILLLTTICAFSLLSAGHALLRKRDPRAALGWIVTCLALPGIGALFYWLLGINRIRTHARELQRLGQGMHWLPPDQTPVSSDIEHYPTKESCQALIRLANTVTRRPLVYGNQVDVLYNGDQAFPAMLKAMTSARESIYLASYIFKPDRIGQQFVRELIAAAERGIDVRVLTDAVGELYSWRKIRSCFRGTAVQTAIFMPLNLKRSFYFNLRNHRKLLIVDNGISFTGGINIRDGHLPENDQPRRILDLHFRFAGPVSEQLRDAFMEDWHFATDHKRQHRSWPAPPRAGTACCRGISAGPNEPHEKLNWIFVGAVNCARSRIRIMTPYFIPSRPQLTALNAASLRGVKVEILLPEKNNLPYVAWAANAYLFEVLEYNCQLYFQPPPFVHSKLFLIDDDYAQVGSANLDPRSLRLNFEFNVEIFDQRTLAELIEHFDTCREGSRKISLEEIDNRSLPVRLRDSFCKLFSPYL